MDAHDLVYDEPARQWEHGVPLGNGVVGAMVWGDGHPLHLTLDHPEFFDDTQALNDHPRNSYRQLRELYGKGDRAAIIEASMMHMRRQGAKDKPPRKVAVGWADLRLPSGAGVRSMRLRLSDATLCVRLAGGGMLEFIAHAELPVVAVRASGIESQTLSLELTPRGLPGGTPEPGFSDGFHWARMAIGDGGLGVMAWAASPDGSCLYLTVHHEHESDPVPGASALLRKALAAGWDELHRGHARAWAEFWARSSINIPDGRFESLWYLELYKLRSSSRRGMLPPNLQGLWPPHDRIPPWGGEHANNINTQMLYWPVYAANHMELLDPLHDWLIDEQLPAGREYARDFYGFKEGAYFQTSSIGRRCYRIGMYATCNLWVAVGAWWCQHLWWAHLHRPDMDVLRDRAYPFMREAMLYYDALLEPDDKGMLHVPMSHSPEWFESEPQAFCDDSTIDLALIRYAARASEQAAELLGLADDAARWKALADHLPPYPVDTSAGLQIFPGQNLTESHRHHSHLMPIYPCGDLNIDGSEDDRTLIRNSLARLERMGMGMWIGFSYPWAACIAARVGKGNTAWRMLDLYVGAFCSPNSFNLNGDFKHQGVSLNHYTPFTNEAGGAAAEAINQMLMQSWGGLIRLFPAMPDHWRDADFTDLRAEGGFVVSASMRERAVVRVQVRCEAAGPCRLLNTFGGPVSVSVNGRTQLMDGREIEFQAELNQVYVLWPSRGSASPPPPASFPGKQANTFGINRHNGPIAPPAPPGPHNQSRL